MNIKKYIMDKSKELNIDMIRFTDSSPLIDIKDFIIERENLGYSTEFEEKDIERRINPKIILPDCKSIIAIALSYNIKYNENLNTDLKGKLSRCSWGLDYHKVLNNKMKKLIEEMEKKVKFNYSYFADTGPLVDREIAKKSGLGYYGKNCTIINEKFGSFIFLGYILTDLDIEEDGIIEGYNCGECNLCLKACPTGALEAPYRLNPKKCISYLTQTKGDIPYEQRKKMGINVYGCDVCQLVCPKNKYAEESSNKEFLPLRTKGYIDIKELFKISNREFKNEYGNMAGSWVGRNTLRRNAIIALGNMKKGENVSFLKELLSLNNIDFNLRKYIYWSLLNIDKKLGKEIIGDGIKDRIDIDEIEKLLRYFKI